VLSFEELTEARRALQSFCLLHVPSLLNLQSGVSFKLDAAEESLDDGKVHHLTTSATCLNSLLEVPPGFFPQAFKRVDVRALRSKFASAALVRTDWVSEGSAGIYCRCRTLPTVVSAMSSIGETIRGHLVEILDQLDKRPERYGIGEAGSELPEEEWYPPNAFHTYWTLDILGIIEARFAAEYRELSNPKELDLTRRRQGMCVWARQQMGHQIGLHSSSPKSSMLDSDQLAWSLAIFLKFDHTLSVNLENRDFVKQALNCLFSTQIDGMWRHYKPLFHYKKAGNAYCYVFETFAALLHGALKDGAKAEMFRELLKPHCKNLMDLWRYADSTKMDLWQSVDSKYKPARATNKDVGWCSGHRTNVTHPESWATASVFSYAQALRRLTGIWSREEALSGLNTPQNRLDPEAATDMLAQRGETWGINKISISERLQTMFVNPVKRHECTDRLEPDSQPIGKHQARSAILFGPPGTSKTTLVRCLADIVGWKYVEIHASHFVAEGLTAVQKTADRIFKQLLEIDHAVVLFDEIDELVRERDMEKDAFGRFLTTSMLPKLAELWEARKVLYFVATNHINYFDSAIIRSHRFDSLMLVSPPSCAAKIDALTTLLKETHGFSGLTIQIEESEVQKALETVEANLLTLLKSESEDSQEIRTLRYREAKLAPELTIAKFALLRHDELDELAFRLASLIRKPSSPPTVISSDIIVAALKEVTDSEWRKNKSYLDYLRDTRSERRDYQMLNVWEAITEETSVPGVEILSTGKWIEKVGDSSKDVKIPNFNLSFELPGLVKITRVPGK
jgi:ATPase family associated with various cellular activities (AAA)